MMHFSRVHGQRLPPTYLAGWRWTLRAFPRLFRGPSYDHIPAQVFGRRSIWAMMSVFFGLLALIPFPNVLNVTRLSSTFVVVEGLVDVMAHLDDEA
jgi:hypothetical protein